VAEAILARYQSWEDLYSGFSQFRGCDDGGPAEVFSDAVVHLLATEWSSLSELASLAGRDEAFQEFILRHIDGTTDDTELQRVSVLAGSDCPSQFASLCRNIELAANHAVREQHVP
jgi:hypothetical protein